MRCGYVDHLEPDGTIHDEWVDSAIYFGARLKTSEIIGVSRLIPNVEELELPVTRAFELHNEWGLWLDALIPGSVSEISALAVGHGFGKLAGIRVVDALIGAMSSYAIVHDQPFLVAAIDRRVFRHLQRLHCLNLEVIGPERHYLGSTTVPVRIDVLAEVRKYEATNPKKIEHFLAATNTEIDLTGERVRLRPRRRFATPALAGSF